MAVRRSWPKLIVNGSSAEQAAGASQPSRRDYRLAYQLLAVVPAGSFVLIARPR